MGKFLGRWAPLVGSLVLVAGAILPLWGQSQLAALILGVGAMLGVNDASPVPAGDVGAAVVAVTAAVAAVSGIVRKVAAVAKAPKA